MTVEAIALALQGRQNKLFTIEVRRPANLRAAHKNLAIEKKSKYQGILCDYARRDPVRKAVDSGERDAPVLPSHIQEVFYCNGVKFWRGKNGETYFPMPITGNSAKAVWLFNNEPVPLDDIKAYLLASEVPKATNAEEKANAEEKGQVIFNAIKIGNIQQIL
jgi:hypothetical protein